MELCGAVYADPLSGYYPNPDQRPKKPWQAAQLDHIDEVLKLAGVHKATKVN